MVFLLFSYGFPMVFNQTSMTKPSVFSRFVPVRFRPSERTSLGTSVSCARCGASKTSAKSAIQPCDADETEEKTMKKTMKHVENWWKLMENHPTLMKIDECDPENIVKHQGHLANSHRHSPSTGWPELTMIWSFLWKPRISSAAGQKLRDKVSAYVPYVPCSMNMVYKCIWYDTVDLLYGYIIWHDMPWYGMIWHDMAWYGMIWRDMAWYGFYFCVIQSSESSFSKPSPMCFSLRQFWSVS